MAQEKKKAAPRKPKAAKPEVIAQAVPAATLEDTTPPTAEGLEIARVLKVTKPLMHGDDVKALQAALIANNYHCGVEGTDGVYAKNTAYAVRCFQAANGLIVDGRAGRFTITALGGKWTGEKIKLQISET